MTFIETLRRPRLEIFDMEIALFDLGGSLMAGYFLGKRLGYNPWLSSIAMIPLGIVVHDIMGVETQINKKIMLLHKSNGV